MLGLLIIARSWLSSESENSSHGHSAGPSDHNDDNDDDDDDDDDAPAGHTARSGHGSRLKHQPQ